MIFPQKQNLSKQNNVSVIAYKKAEHSPNKENTKKVILNKNFNQRKIKICPFNNNERNSFLRECESIQNLVKNSVDKVHDALKQSTSILNLHKLSFTSITQSLKKDNEKETEKAKDNINPQKKELKIKLNSKIFKRKGLTLNLKTLKESFFKIPHKRINFERNNSTKDSTESLKSIKFPFSKQNSGLSISFMRQRSNSLTSQDKGIYHNSFHNIKVKSEFQKTENSLKIETFPNKIQNIHEYSLQSAISLNQFLKEKLSLKNSSQNFYKVKEKLLAVYKGWKVRKIMKSEAIQKIILELRKMAYLYKKNKNHNLEIIAYNYHKLFIDSFYKMFQESKAKISIPNNCFNNKNKAFDCFVNSKRINNSKTPIQREIYFRNYYTTRNQESIVSKSTSDLQNHINDQNSIEEKNKKNNNLKSGKKIMSPNIKMEKNNREKMMQFSLQNFKNQFLNVNKDSKNSKTFIEISHFLNQFKNTSHNHNKKCNGLNSHDSKIKFDVN